jgi:hypothetical protein
MDMQFKAGDVVTYTDGRRATVTGYVSEVTRHVALTDDTGLTFTAGEPELRRALWTRDQISAALNAGAEIVLDDEELFGVGYADGHQHIRYSVPGSTSWWWVCPYDLMMYPSVPLHERRFEQG